jgi:predicted small secreted protein
MKWKHFLIGAACGLATGWLVQTFFHNNQLLSSEEVIKKVKDSLKTEGKISGSWIITKPETLERDLITYQVYRGGITKLTDNDEINMEFLADAKTGTILEVKKI